MTDTEMNIAVHERVMGGCAHLLTVKRSSPRSYRCSKCGQDGFDFMTDYEGRVLVRGLLHLLRRNGIIACPAD